jgi:TolB-like protein
MERRLAAILAADVVGYSRLMEQDELGTLAALKERRKGILEPLVAQHHGRIVKVMGDGVLVEFASAVNAVACAVELQKAMAKANDDRPPDRRIGLRVGVNLGDVVVEGGDLYGDGVIIAARLQAMAEPGGVCVAASVQEQVGTKLPIAFDDLGPCDVKNISRPIQVFRVRVEIQEAEQPRIRPPAPDRPSIAVLPFTNMSGDPEQQYFSDGITEDIITELSRFRELFVIARNSSFRFRDKSVDVKRIGRELGVGCVVEGSVRRAGNRIRVTAQLVEVTTGSHLWAEHYDRDLQDIFAVQDEIAQTVVATLVGRLTASGADRARSKPTEHWAAYDFFLQGRECVNRYDVETAEPLLRRATELDPDFAQAHAMLARLYVFRFFSNGRAELLRDALVHAKTAVSLDEHDARCHWALATVYLFMKQLDLAGVHYSKAVALNPSDTDATSGYAHWLARMGRTSEALEKLDIAVKCDPFAPDWYWELRAVPLLQEKRYEEFLENSNHISRHQVWHHPYLAAAYAHLGRFEEAKASAAEVLRLKPDYSSKWIIAMEPYKNPADLEHLLDGLRKAGLPE